MSRDSSIYDVFVDAQSEVTSSPLLLVHFHVDHLVIPYKLTKVTTRSSVKSIYAFK